MKNTLTVSLALAVFVCLMHLSVEGAVPTTTTIHRDLLSTDDVVPEGPAASTRRDGEDELGLVQGTQPTEKQQHERSHTLDRWLDVKRQQKKQAALGALKNDGPSTPPPSPAPSPPSGHTRRRRWHPPDMPDPVLHPVVTPPATAWRPWHVPGDFTNYDEISATRACNNWLRNAADLCQSVSNTAEACTQQQLAATSRAARTVTQSCVRARQECASTLEWCRAEPQSSTCDSAGDSCSRINPLCHHRNSHLDLRTALARCIPAQKYRVLKCGEAYAKAYSACWHGYDALQRRPVVDTEQLEEEVAVHRCGKEFAKSTLGCEHRVKYFEVVSSRTNPSHLEQLVQQRDSTCQDVHRAGQAKCSAAWKQLDSSAQDRDAKARSHAKATAVFWPASTPIAASPAMLEAADSLPATMIRPTVPEQAANSALLSAGGDGHLSQGGDLSQLLKATQQIQQQVAESAMEAPEAMVQEEVDVNPVVTLKSRVHPSPFKSSTDVADGVFSHLDAAEAARKAAIDAQKRSLSEKRKQIMAAELKSGADNSVDPAVHGEAAYHQKHPLSVAMQTCRGNQRAAAVRCLHLGMGACHNTWVEAYMTCFSVLGEAKAWLQRDGSLPPATSVHKQGIASVPLPPDVQQTAQLSCAQSYSKFSQACSQAHRRSGALCRHFATRGGLAITAMAKARCGANHRQAQSVCAHAQSVGRASCDTAWATARAIVTTQHRSAARAAPVTAPRGVSSQRVRLKRAQAQTMTRVQEASRRLQEARRTGMIKRDSVEMENALLLELMGAHGVGLALHGALQHEQLNQMLLQL